MLRSLQMLFLGLYAFCYYCNILFTTQCFIESFVSHDKSTKEALSSSIHTIFASLSHSLKVPTFMYSFLFFFSQLDVVSCSCAAGLCRVPEPRQAAVFAAFFWRPHISRGEIKIPLIDLAEVSPEYIHTCHHTL